MTADFSSIIERFGVGKRGSLAVVHQGTGYFACTPQAPYDGSIGVAEQTRQLLAKAEGRLAEIGSAKQGLIFCAIMLADMDDYAAMNEVWDEWVSGMAPPARACFEARLASPDLKVEMIMVAAAATA
ncbi:Enamine deaminase RidA, house cleaning of reactive enamine intermediates, YjgF/YER057c/UK114 family [Xaviernesmea oryzae]|uniref:Enamine deaminase RidA, house cleaning of reactive enamine intermediates, YjgF/YER057c/UK114 family n=1 Tax=Xaviernesmea oryzae TaxID=464029 RepID=A0A1X7D8E9_9HYPH|nr:RidA family protein [Xaviernesmea oryzae]SMF10567.1 Enamine deaminase RidA, house cleaning of reactive enamine intermediates, YjgF/YER057c/UK114 family [Xaviernesmea oryzae]